MKTNKKVKGVKSIEAWAALSPNGEIEIGYIYSTKEQAERNVQTDEVICEECGSELDDEELTGEIIPVLISPLKRKK